MRVESVAIVHKASHVATRTARPGRHPREWGDGDPGFGAPHPAQKPMFRPAESNRSFCSLLSVSSEPLLNFAL